MVLPKARALVWFPAGTGLGGGNDTATDGTSLGAEGSTDGMVAAPIPNSVFCAAEAAPIALPVLGQMRTEAA